MGSLGLKAPPHNHTRSKRSMTNKAAEHQPIQEQTWRAFRLRYPDGPGLLVRAPGRVNLIGEHTDYNDGFVLPMAIDRAVWVALQPVEEDRVWLHSLDFDESVNFALEPLEHSGPGWIEYVRGVAWALQQHGYRLTGWRGVIRGDVPRGAGLSSSAAVELAAARAFAATADIPWEPRQMALLAQKAENRWVGVNCGIMDQMISAAAQEGQALLIDCRSLETRPAPLPEESLVVILDTATRRGLVDSAYNERRQQCEAAAKFFGVPALRDVTLPEFEQRSADLEMVVRRRARHVIGENQRTLEAVQAMQHGDAARLGQLMNASHVSLRDDFEVSRWELDLIVDLAQRQAGCFGARMTGAGFGGCAVALVHRQAVGTFVAQVAPAYRLASGLTPAVYVCHASDGARLVSPPGA
jgi:galactokinase